MSRVFVLEGDPERLRWFRQRLFNHEVDFADSCTQVDRFVGPYYLVLLDHDLGGRQLEEHEDNGTAFARAIKDRIGEAIVLIHSYNMKGAMNICSALELEPVTAYFPFRGKDFYHALDMLLADGAFSEEVGDDE